uniref:DUF1981 domain-containing protein n=1 Tax=Syphacia muris TaxID=451379 RepID=A0A0N5ABM5_9BILA
MTHMVNSHWDKIISGWKNVFSVFTMAASSNDEDIVETTVFASEFGNGLDSFQDAIKCLSEFACNSNFPDISMEAIRLIRLCASYVSQNQELIIEHQWEDGASIQPAQRVFLRGWFPIMFELSCIIGRCKLDVRTRSLTVMFEIMKTYGNEFKNEWWKDIFQVAFRIFDVMKLAEENNEKKEWMRTTCNHALYAVVDVFTQYYEMLSIILLDNIFDQLKWCAKQEDEQLARSAINCLENLVQLNGLRFTDSMWAATVDLIKEIFDFTLPHSLLTWEPETLLSSVSVSNSDEIQANNEPVQPAVELNNSTKDMLFSSLLVRCVVQLELVDAVNSIVFGTGVAYKDEMHVFPSTSATYTQESSRASAPGSEKIAGHKMDNVVGDEKTVENDDDGLFSCIGVDRLLCLVNCLLQSHKLAKKFNGNNAQRTLLWKAGFKGRSKPNLLRQETHSIRCALGILYTLYAVATDDQKLKIKRELKSVAADAINYYVRLSNDHHRQAWTLVLDLILDRSCAFGDEQLLDLGIDYAMNICQLVECEIKEELKPKLSRLLQKCIYVSYV